MGIILVVGGIKGGIGKSTMASNIAVLAALDGLSVMLIDADSSDQQTTLRWAAERNDNAGAKVGVTTMALHGRSIRDELLRLAAPYDLVIVDPGARDSDTQRFALSAADVVLLPFTPRGPDLWTLDGVVEMLTHVRKVNPPLRALAFVNRADSKGDNNAEALRTLAEYADSVESLAVTVGNRVAIPNAHLAGLSAVEMPRPDYKACAELRELWQRLVEVFQRGTEAA